MSVEEAALPHRPRKRQVALKLLMALLFLYIFLIGVRGLGSGFKGLGSNLLDSFFTATENPFVGLVVGILATTLIQSSSASTSMIVALVAAPSNPLPIANAIPMIMGANIGTTVTNTLVSLGHFSRKEEFKRAFAAATVHDFFNFMVVAVMLPLEVATGMLEKASHALASSFVGASSMGKLPNPIKTAVKGGLAPIKDGSSYISGGSKGLASALLIAVSALIIFASLYFIVRTLRELAATRVQLYISRSLGVGGAVSILVGAIVTVMVQSSSITTSILVPLAGAGVVDVAQVFPITLGANIGTTFTALIAASAAPTATAHLAVQIALVHTLFNCIGVAAVYAIPQLREIPIRLSKRLAEVASRSRKVALIYVLGLFYGFPAACIFISRMF